MVLLVARETARMQMVKPAMGKPVTRKTVKPATGKSVTRKPATVLEC